MSAPEENVTDPHIVRNVAPPGVVTSVGLPGCVGDLLQAFVTISPSPVIIVNAQGVIVELSDAAASLFGYRDAELTGQPIACLIPENLRSRHHRLQAEYLRDPETREMGENREILGRHKDGREFRLQIGLKALQFGDTRFVVCAVTNIAKILALRNELLRQHRLLTAIAENTPDSIFVKDVDGRYLFINRAAAEYLDKSREDLLGKTANEFLSPESAREVMRDEQAVMRSGAAQTVENSLSIGGTVRYSQATKTPYRDASGKIIGVIGIARDITAIKQAENQLRETNRRYQHLLNNSPTIIYSTAIGETYRSTFVSENCRSLLGYSVEQMMVGGFWYDNVHPDDAATVSSQVTKAIEAGGGRIEYRFRDAAGRYRWICDQFVVDYDEDGRPVEVMGVWIDVTERKKSEESLRVRTIAMEAAAYGIMITGHDGNILWVNPAFTRLTGYSAEEAIGQNPRLLKSGQHDQSSYQDLWSRILAGEVWRGQLVNRRKDGTLYIEEQTITPVRAESGDISHFIAIKQDITDRKRDEERIARFGRIFEGSLNEIYLFDADTLRFAQVNSAAQDNLGYTLEELQEKTPLDLKPEFTIDSFAKLIEPLRTGEKEKIVFETVHKRKDQSLYDVEVHLQFMKHEQETLFAAIILDITDRKQALEEQKKLNADLRRLSHRAGMAEVATGVLHNVGNVLNSLNISAQQAADTVRNLNIEGFSKAAGMLRDRLGDPKGTPISRHKSQQLADYLDGLARRLSVERESILEELSRVGNSIRHITEIVSRQQSMARSGAMTEVIILCDLVDEILESTFGDCDSIAIDRDYESLPALVLDRHGVLQILENLISNGKRALLDKGAEDQRLTVRIRRRDDDHVTVLVRDNGIGIPEAQGAKIFTFGYTSRGDGHGFGLHASANLARSMGGSLTCASEGAGCGATFTLELPLLPVNLPPPGKNH